jgi:integrase
MKGKVYENKSGQGAPFYVQFFDAGQRVFKRFWSYRDADIFLTGLNFEAHHETLDVREWQKDDPIGFTTLAQHYLLTREGMARSFADIRRHINLACDHFGRKPVKRIIAGDIQDFHRDLPAHLSLKSQQNILKTVRGFFNWILEREEIAKVPKFPQIQVNMEMRRIVDKETQEAIIEEVRRITPFNPKIVFAIQCLATYINVRPNELRLIKEGDIDLKDGTITVRHTKEGKHKRIYLLPEDVDFIRSFPRGLPHLHFFRHDNRQGVARVLNGVFGEHYLYSWWKQACANLGIEGVDLYGGTRHSSVSALADHFGPDEIQHYGTGHISHSFQRYFQVGREKRLTLAEATRNSATVLIHKKGMVHSIKGVEKTG